MRPVNKNYSQKQRKAAGRRKKNSGSANTQSGSTSSEQSSFRKAIVNPKQRGKWGHVQKPTQAFVASLLQSCLDKVCGETERSSQTGVQRTLEDVKHRMLEKLDSVKAPGNKSGVNYSDMNDQFVALEKLDLKFSEQAETLENAIEKCLRLTDKTREKIKEFEHAQMSDPVKKTLFMDTDTEAVQTDYVDYGTVELLDVSKTTGPQT